MKKQVVRPLALATVLGCASLAPAAVISWTLNANGSWGVDGNWNAAPAWDGTDDIVLEVTAANAANRTLTVDGSRIINSLTGVNVNNTSNRNIALNPGTPSSSILQINTGNITIDGTGYASSSTFASPLNLGNTPVQIGDGVTPVTNATWHLFNMGTYGTNSRGRTGLTMGEVIGMAGTEVTLTGAYAPAGTGGGTTLTMSKTSNNWSGKLTIDSVPNVTLIAQANNALGSSSASVDVKTFTVFQFSTTSTQQDAAINLSFAGDTYIAATAANVVTLNGNLTGTGNLALNKNGTASTLYGTGTVAVNGGNNTLSGNVYLYAGTLRVDGDWTGAGDVTISHIYTSSGLPFVLSGSGSLTTAANKTILIKGNDHNLSTSGGSDALVAPGTDGVIGTLTLGTSGTGKLKFDARSFLNIDLDGILADQLVVLGDLDLNQSVALSKGNGINLNVLNALTLPYYTLVSYTGSLSGTFANVTGVPAGYSLSYDTPGEIRLVNPDIIPEPATLGLLAVGGLVMIRRHRRGD